MPTLFSTWMNRARNASYSIAWNLFIITVGAALFSWSIKAIAVPHGFIPGGLFGLAVLISNLTSSFDPGTWFFIVNVPLMLLGWFKVSRRFCLYTMYAMTASTILYSLIDIPIVVDNLILSSIAAGTLMGMGAGLIFRSLGAGGGLDIVAIIINQRWGIGVGKTFFFFNLLLFSYSLPKLGVDLVMASLITVFISGVVIEYVLSLFNQRKVVFIISRRSDEIAEKIMLDLRRSGTFLRGYGAYSGRDLDVLMTVINNIQLKKLEEITFTIDPQAMFIVENTFNVLGTGFSKRKVY